MTTTCTWGSWEDTWLGGRFVCVFTEARAVDGWIEAGGLYRAKDGEAIADLDTVDEQIAQRAVIVGNNGATVRVCAESAALIANTPALSKTCPSCPMAHCV